MHARRARLDHRLHELEGVERPAETRLGVGDDRREPIPRRRAHPLQSLGVLHLIRPLECLVDAANHVRDAVGRIEALVGIGLPREIGVGRDLPAAQVDGLESRADLLHRLVPRESPERVHVVGRPEQVPEAARPAVGQRLHDPDRAAQPLHVLLRIGTRDARPPVGGDGGRLVRLRRDVGRGHDGSSSVSVVTIWYAGSVRNSSSSRDVESRTKRSRARR